LFSGDVARHEQRQKAQPQFYEACYLFTFNCYLKNAKPYLNIKFNKGIFNLYNNSVICWQRAEVINNQSRSGVKSLAFLLGRTFSRRRRNRSL